jgi:hypothetical protein
MPMSGETATNVSAWTIDSLHEHYEVVLREMDKRYQQHFDSQEKATLTALDASHRALSESKDAAEKRFVLLNELRSVVVERDATFITRAEADAISSRFSERIQELTDRLNRSEARLNVSEGRDSGFHAGWGYLIAFIGVLGVIATIYITLKH